MATINVTSTADSGAGTLRQAIIDLNAQTGSHTITFTGLTGTITLASALPALTKSMTITGPGLSSLTISGNNLYRVFDTNNSLTFFISALTIANGKATAAGIYNNWGGGIRNGTSSGGADLTISNCYFTGCYAGVGGAISSYGNVTVTNTSFVSNTGTSGASGIHMIGGVPTIGKCTFSGNTGVAFYTQVSGSIIYNSTFNGNTHSSNSAIQFDIRGTASLLSSTISGNASGSGPYSGAVYLGEYCSLTLKNTIISGNTGVADFNSYNSNRSIASAASNIIGTISAGSAPSAARIIGDPLLGALQNNGGTTQTMAVGAGSVAINAGNATASNASPVSGLDQRDTARSATTPTIGAFEYTGSSPPTVSSISPSTGTSRGGTSVTITGANLIGASSVTIGGVAATSVTVINSTTITATTPAGTVGTASVLVTTSIGTNAANTLFTYFIPPNTVRIKRSSTTSVSPTSLLEGELAANIVDKKVWIGDSNKTPVLISDYKAMGTVTSVGLTVPTGLSVANSPITTANTLAVTLTAGYSIPTTVSQTNWDSAYTQRLQWDGGSTNLVAATGKTSLGLGNVENTALSTWTGSTNITTVGSATTRNLTIAPLSQSNTTASKCLTVTAPAHTNLTAGSYCTDIHINLARTVQFAWGTLPAQTAIKISAPTYDINGLAAAGIASTVQIDSAPIMSANTSSGYSTALNILTGVPTGTAIAITSATSQSADIFRITNSTNMKPFSILNTGAVVLGTTGTQGAAGTTNELRFLEVGTLANGPMYYVGFKAPDTINSNVIWTLPAADGKAGQALTTNAGGVLSWSSAGSGTVTSVAALTLGTTGTDVSSTVATGTTTPVITLNIPTASATNRGALSSADWSNFNTAYTNRITSLTTTGSSGAATLATNTLNVPNYTLAGLGGQASSTNLTSVAGLTYASTSFVKMTAAGTFGLDTNSYVTTSGNAATATSATTATNIAGGGAGQVPYNTASGATSFLAAGTAGQVLQSNGTSAPSWSTVTAGSSVTTSATAPATPTAGNQWYDTNTGIIYTYVNDGTSSQWVQGSTATLDTGVPAGGTTNQFLVKSSATDYATAWTGTLINPTFTNYTETLYDAGTGSAFTLNLSNGTIQKFTTNANMTLTLPASTAGKSFVVMVVYGGVNTLTWSSPSTLKWVGGTVPTATSVAGKIDIFSFFQDGTNTYGTVYGQNF